jgi:hypothetical protein
MAVSFVGGGNRRKSLRNFITLCCLTTPMKLLCIYEHIHQTDNAGSFVLMSKRSKILLNKMESNTIVKIPPLSLKLTNNCIIKNDNSIWFIRTYIVSYIYIYAFTMSYLIGVSKRDIKFSVSVCDLSE